MKSITIHNLDEASEKAIQKIVDETGLSQNKVVKQLLRKALGLPGTKKTRPDFSKFLGVWSSEEARDFEQHVKAFEQIDENLWK